MSWRPLLIFFAINTEGLPVNYLRAEREDAQNGEGYTDSCIR